MACCELPKDFDIILSSTADICESSQQSLRSVLMDMVLDADQEKAGRAMQAMLKISKLDVAALQKAYEGE